MVVRTFIGISLPLLTRQTLVAAQEAMRAASPAWRHEKWVAESNLHLTLRFLGPVPEGLLPAVSTAMNDATADMESFQVRIGAIRAVPRLRSATMLWVTMEEGKDEIADLARRVDTSLVDAGFSAETRPFDPHITLVRSRSARRIDFDTMDAGDRTIFAAEERAKRVSVRRVTLFSSSLTPQGPVYEELESSSLAT